MREDWSYRPPGQEGSNLINRPQQPIAKLDRAYAKALTRQAIIFADCLIRPIRGFSEFGCLDMVAAGSNFGQYRRYFGSRRHRRIPLLEACATAIDTR
jgi:hypothetical protein